MSHENYFLYEPIAFGDNYFYTSMLYCSIRTCIYILVLRYYSNISSKYIYGLIEQYDV